MIQFNEEELERFRWSTIKIWIHWVIIFFSLLPLELYFKIFNRTRVLGRENLPKGGGVLFAANHNGWADTLILPITCINRWDGVPFLAPAKEELFKIPVVSTLISVWGAFPVKRRARDIDSMKRIAYSAYNYRVMIFPEGTRSRDGVLGRGRAGAGWVVQAARPTVIPTLLINTDQYERKGFYRWVGNPYWVVFGEPVDLSPLEGLPDNKETSQLAIDLVMEAIADMRVKYRHLFTEPPKLTGHYYESTDTTSDVATNGE
jgi:1-acyl-sn-glycerol-3-phosphate acyltransferase